MALPTHIGHWARMREAERFATLQPTQQDASFDPRSRGEGRRLDLAM